MEIISSQNLSSNSNSSATIPQVQAYVPTLLPVELTQTNAHSKNLKPSETKELIFKFEFKFEFKSNFKHMNFNLSHTEDHSEYEPIQWNSVIITLIHPEDCKDVDREQHEQPNF